LFNALAGAGRAIVTDIPGTTRDLLTERVEICGLAVTLVDTAGLRQSPENSIEAEGMARARQAAERAHLAVVVLDGAHPLSREDLDLLAIVPAEGRLVVVNKADLPAAWPETELGVETVPLSALTGLGVENLRIRIARSLGLRESLRDTPAITNIRHVALLERARVSLDRAREAASAGMPEELVAADLGESRALLEEITGQRGSEATLHAIFERFCIGK
jgi:tRNA modification GTPase